MYDYKTEFVNVMKKGQSQELFDRLHKSLDEAYEEVKRQEAAETQKREEELDKQALTMLCALRNYIAIIKPELVKFFPQNKERVALMRAAIDDSVPTLCAMVNLGQASSSKTGDTDEKIHDFLKNFGLI